MVIGREVARLGQAGSDEHAALGKPAEQLLLKTSAALAEYRARTL
jgi:hypothetical protein